VAIGAALLIAGRQPVRVALITLAAVIAVTAAASRWSDTLVNFDTYDSQEASGKYSMVYTVVPFSPDFGRSDLHVKPPLAKVAEVAPETAGRPVGERTVILGTDALGKDVFSQMLWACRLSISIGLVSTGIAVLIGVTMGAIMGYFGGWVDLLLYRVVEIFMAIPVLFLLIVAAAVLPRNTYMMMAIIGCVSWTGAARFTRAEFLKLRKQDFVQGAQAAGLPLRSVLFRHMLPNGVTPVLVDASFAVAAAIIAEATLSYLGLGPDGQPSWGKLLSSATGTTGTFVWWLAIFPGLAIFFTVLSYNMLGEAMRDAIDPKLRKAAH
jgi:peptide/nickel transport system permease protein